MRPLYKALAIAWVLFFWAPTLLMIPAAALRAYFPAGIVLTPSAMPELWPLSLVVVVPADSVCQFGDGYYVYYLDEGQGLVSHMPFVHYVSCPSKRMVINAKAALETLPQPPQSINPVDWVLHLASVAGWYIDAMLPPYRYLVLPAPTQNVVGYVAWYVDGRVVAVLWAAVIAMPPLVYATRRVF